MYRFYTEKISYYQAQLTDEEFKSVPDVNRKTIKEYIKEDINNEKKKGSGSKDIDEKRTREIKKTETAIILVDKIPNGIS